MPALIARMTFVQRPQGLFRRHCRGPILSGKDHIIGLASNLTFRKAQQSLSTYIPAGDPPLPVNGEDGVLTSVFKDHAQVPLGGSYFGLQARALLLSRFALGNVNKSQDHPRDLVLGCAIRQQPRNEPASIAASSLSLDWCESVKHALGIGNNEVVFKLMTQIGKRSPNVGRNQVK